MGIGSGGISPDVRQRQSLKEEFESRVVAVCLKPEGTQILERIHPINRKIERAIGLDPSKLRAEFQRVATNCTCQLVLNLINSRRIAQKE